MTKKVIDDNIMVHTMMAARYNEEEPHFRPENKAKVTKVLKDLRGRAPGGKLLDLGCGTGFIIALAIDIFDEIHGVDITQAMLDRVDTSSGKVILHRGAAEELPFPNGTFDVVTAYSFLHHTGDYWTVLREASRVLRNGGLCYVDLEPNKAFWRAMSGISSEQAQNLSPSVRKAWESVVENDERVAREFGIPKDAFRNAEYSKSILGGLDPEEIRQRAVSLGFVDCAIRLEWFAGQAEVMHGESFEIADRIDRYLREAAPLTNHLFKYLQVVLVK